MFNGEQIPTTEAMKNKCLRDFKLNYPKLMVDHPTYNKFLKMMCDDGNLWRKSRKFKRNGLEYQSAKLRNYLYSKDTTNNEMNALIKYMDTKDAADRVAAEDEARENLETLYAARKADAAKSVRNIPRQDMGGSRRRRKNRSRRRRL